MEANLPDLRANEKMGDKQMSTEKVLLKVGMPSTSAAAGGPASVPRKASAAPSAEEPVMYRTLALEHSSRISDVLRSFKEVSMLA